MSKNGELWVFIRNVLQQGEAIGKDFAAKPYEEYSARLDGAARERLEELNGIIKEGV